jgi:hypothetical protein
MFEEQLGSVAGSGDEDYQFAVCDNLSTNGLATAGVAAVPSTMSLFFRSLP